MSESMSSSPSSSPLTFMGMITVILLQAGNMVINKVVLSEGINKYCLILFTDFLCTLIFLPSIFILFRSGSPPLTPSVIFKIFLFSLIGFTAYLCSLAGTELSSPTLEFTLLNVVPALTFSLAIFFRMEKLDWKSSSSQVKLLGTVVSIAGACIATLYKGHPIMFVASTKPHLALSPQAKWTLGGFFFAVEALLFSMLYIIQAMIVKEYPVILIINLISSIFGTGIAASMSLVQVGSDAQAWKLSLEKGLVSIVYTAVATGVLRSYLVQWCLMRTGPLYVSMFKPVGIIFTVALGVIFLRDPLLSGSLIGAAVIVCGFYAVMWGKAKEEKCEDVYGELVGIVLIGAAVIVCGFYTVMWEKAKEEKCEDVDGEVAGRKVSAQTPDNPNHKTPLLVARTLIPNLIDLPSTRRNYPILCTDRR